MSTKADKADQLATLLRSLLENPAPKDKEPDEVLAKVNKAKREEPDVFDAAWELLFGSDNDDE